MEHDASSSSSPVSVSSNARFERVRRSSAEVVQSNVSGSLSQAGLLHKLLNPKRIGSNKLLTRSLSDSLKYVESDISLTFAGCWTPALTGHTLSTPSFTSL
ncbi:hypothetical protein AMATHDRAFT_69834 [Amanita thiersii Skay4041]|uniref:Uncharacterized protein n=1 Tax=Amanita thiersii Skay4041 TaxID=703135 RepID=A0A2A9NFG9_9AGAR|nr:hypothetical protein AMATHDRAFT_69834 [Amanita thiersii Skay4041]